MQEFFFPFRRAFRNCLIKVCFISKGVQGTAYYDKDLDAKNSSFRNIYSYNIQKDEVSLYL